MADVMHNVNQVLPGGTGRNPAAQKEWAVSEDDCFQVSRKVCDTVFEFMQIIQMPEDGYRIAHCMIDLDCYPEEDYESAIGTYGYSSIMFFRKMNGEESDRCMAELFFEMEALDSLEPETYGSLAEAAAALQERVHIEVGNIKGKFHEQNEKNFPHNEGDLMQRLLTAGFSKDQMHHYGTDLYVPVTPLTTQVIKQWCEENRYKMEWVCPTFMDAVDHVLSYDCVFQYHETEL